MMGILTNYSPYNDEIASHAWTHSTLRHRCREVNGGFDTLTLGECFAIARAIQKVSKNIRIPLNDAQIQEIKQHLNNNP